jgi:hypothetical protein
MGVEVLQPQPVIIGHGAQAIFNSWICGPQSDTGVLRAALDNVGFSTLSAAPRSRSTTCGTSPCLFEKVFAGDTTQVSDPALSI